MGSPAVWPDQEKHPQEEPPEMRQREDQGSQAGKGGREVGGDRRSARGAWRQARRAGGSRAGVQAAVGSEPEEAGGDAEARTDLSPTG